MSVTSINADKWVLPNVKIASGTIEALKWLGLLLMTGDHVNKYLFNATLPFLFEIGRLAMPIFVLILAYNLARPTLDVAAYKRATARLSAFAVISMVPCMLLGGLVGGWWPLNILFTLLTLVAVIYFIECKAFFLAFVVFVVAGLFVEYWWPALVLGVTAWAYFKKPSVLAAVGVVLSSASLFFINGNMWALAALPLVILSTLVDVKVPRLRWVFYAYYPLHLGVIHLISVI